MTPEDRFDAWVISEFIRAHGREPTDREMYAEARHAAIVGWNTTSAGYVRRLPLRQIRAPKVRVEAVAAAEFGEPMAT